MGNTNRTTNGYPSKSKVSEYKKKGKFFLKIDYIRECERLALSRLPPRDDSPDVIVKDLSQRILNLVNEIRNYRKL
jgi:hypothetical protein